MFLKKIFYSLINQSHDSINNNYIEDVTNQNRQEIARMISIYCRVLKSGLKDTPADIQRHFWISKWSIEGFYKNNLFYFSIPLIKSINTTDIRRLKNYITRFLLNSKKQALYYLEDTYNQIKDNYYWELDKILFDPYYSEAEKQIRCNNALHSAINDYKSAYKRVYGFIWDSKIIDINIKGTNLVFSIDMSFINIPTQYFPENIVF